MSVSLSIKNVPDEVVERLRQNAERHNRSLQGELLNIVIEQSKRKAFDAADFLAETRLLDYSSPDESTAMIRADRDNADRRR